MKKVINAGIGGKSFTLDEDAYLKMEAYLKSFSKQLDKSIESAEVMEEVEGRIADLLTEFLSSSYRDVVSISTVEKVISRIGLPDGSTEFHTDTSSEGHSTTSASSVSKRFFRDTDQKIIGGVCSGLAAYFDIDVTLVRILAIILLFFATAGFWAYIVIWIVVPQATNAVQKCQMHGVPATAENIKLYSNTK